MSLAGKSSYQFGDVTRELLRRSTGSLHSVFRKWSPPGARDDGDGTSSSFVKLSDRSRSPPAHDNQLDAEADDSTRAGRGAGAGAGAGDGGRGGDGAGGGGGAVAAAKVPFPQFLNNHPQAQQPLVHTGEPLLSGVRRFCFVARRRVPPLLISGVLVTTGRACAQDRL